MLALLGRLAIAGFLLLGIGAGLTYLYFAVRLDETMSVRNWEIPSRLFPAPLTLEVGERIPPGPLEDTLEAMGYHIAKPVQKPGEYRAAGPGHYYLRSRSGWPGLNGVEDRTLDLKVDQGAVSALRIFKGKRLERAVVPPVAFSEIRSPSQESRQLVKFAQMPKHLIDAVLAIEDKRFYKHFGIDPRGLARAVFVNLIRSARAQGGSTLTQQLAKNYFLTQEKTYLRKLKEMFLALAIERKYTKNEILELYLNEIYLGQRGAAAICGVGQASHLYFSKDVQQLDLHEAALLAGLIQAPNACAPDRHPERAKKRRDTVLQNMFELGMIDAPTLKNALAKPLSLRLAPYIVDRTAPYLVDLTTERMGEIFPELAFNAEGYTIETTVDLRIQRYVEKALSDHLDNLDQSAQAPLEGAVVVLQPSTGRILAMAGGRNYGKSQFNRATQALRQPGSAFKPLLMLAALQAKGTALSPTTRLEDEPLTLKQGGKDWSPQNSDRQFRGEVTLRQTLEQSLNVPTVRLAMDVGMEKIVSFYHKLGLERPLEPLPSLALGALDVSPLEVAAAFTPLADNGIFSRPYAVQRILDRSGTTIYEAPRQTHRVASAAEVFMIRDMMRGVLEAGTAKSARALGYTYEAAGKTGTTNDSRDAWFVGFDSELLVVVWVGSDRADPAGFSGAKAALPIWVDIMASTRKGSPPPPDPVPKGISVADVCTESLEKPTEQCPEVRKEVFWAGDEPDKPCSIHATPKDNIEDALGRIKSRLRAIFERSKK